MRFLFHPVQGFANAAIAAIEPAGPAIIRAAIWHWTTPVNVRLMRQNCTRNVIAEGIASL